MSDPLILVVEDDHNLAKLLKYNLEKAGYKCQHAESGEAALELLKGKVYDLMLLDIMLPGMDGFEVCRKVRQHQLYKELPVVMLTAKGEEIDKVLGFELGIDDYVVKPFSPRELNLRIRAILKRDRRGKREIQEVMKSGDLEVDISRHKVSSGGKELTLTLMEFKLLVVLLQRKGQAQSRETLLSDVWDVDKNINTRTIDTHITRLREKLGDAGRQIKTVRGLGYKFDETPDAGDEE
ncbi:MULTISPECIES: response regulator transcription factor [Prosthecochloris]|uniref:Response regulator transcription factor n=1 Tax=Prosthecochloris vibrioformis TaxID=1098 RepID=A0A5C4RZ29_PROVB|nr:MULTISPECIES: response regulator transcription factor [Prosthecochloris]ANT65306.1 Alkaline phosphatase synthesis transcriptional regulatory protein PhoP [Prosthecochloris sp. CIB 2401]TNJ36189.1 response regulator transcription factor [Prosthecochloris vibrioformis]